MGIRVHNSCFQPWLKCLAGAVPNKMVSLGAALIDRTYGPSEELVERCGMLDFMSFKTKGCAECEKGMKENSAWGWVLQDIAVPGAAPLLIAIILAIGAGMILTVFLSVSIVAAGVIITSYRAYGRRVFCYTFKDSKGRWHTHLDEPQKKCGAYICMADFQSTEDMIIKEPILKVQVRGWGRKRHEILNGNFGNWTLSDFHHPVGGVNEGGGRVLWPFNLTLDNGSTRQKNVGLDMAYRIIQSRYVPVYALAEYDLDETNYLRAIAASHAMIQIAITDIIELINASKGSSSSKIGMAARVMLEKIQESTAEVRALWGSGKLKVNDVSARYAQEISRCIVQNIAAEAAKSATLRNFVAAKPQYLPPDEKPADAAGEAKAT